MQVTGADGANMDIRGLTPTSGCYSQ
ncbi:hypothetical protein FMEAI12_6790002 [Parafrankia sp. Ea1.12]|nr:hypothetical protein FMEAI12_6790002 [Parafrankia sp. Ea1.12]